MMQHFKYRFQSLLNIKEKLEENKKLELGKALQNLEHEKKRLSDLIRKREESIEQYRDKTSKIVSISTLKEASSNVYHFDSLINLQENKVKKKKSDVEVCKTGLALAKKETKMFEKIKEKDKIQHKYLLEKEEEEKIDSFVSFNSSVKQRR
ncbi:flagellar export protein FliJ [Serpentinicella sp. ANB-PHB4]|uniref:flagellar export protein FliJ n=1 Tax=Serpentinicella sp. ANB-PHB4 TaxID=3074076 RepID=UPI00285A2462|nr:flagellar export protein FliJ [Serpentinicella sp. ANB-PHB4]MDR5658268.1 flagellar export protein FliJ [Serpentinicella sp. ANB-PHB4]